MLDTGLCWVRYSKMRLSSRSSSTCIWFLGVSAYFVRISVISFVDTPKSFATSCTLYLFPIVAKQSHLHLSDRAADGAPCFLSYLPPFRGLPLPFFTGRALS